MTTSRRRAVLTGLGILSAIGSDPKSFWEALLQGKSGVRPVQAFDTAGLPTRIAAELPNFAARSFLQSKDHQKSLRMMARPLQIAVAVAALAIDQSKIDKKKLDPTRFGVEFGAGLIAIELPELVDAALAAASPEPGTVDLEKWGTQSIPVIPPLWMLKYLPNMMACHVSMQHDAQGPNNTITQSDVASLLAMGEAWNIVRRDAADYMLVGGAESKINPLSMVRQCLFEPLSKRNDDPTRACRPFDKDRDGLVLGEGGTVMALEDLTHAQNRGATIYAEVVGFGAAFDHSRNGQGIARSIKVAMKQAGITADDLDHVNANGLATGPSDRWEARGLEAVFGSNMPPVFAGKGYFGNLGAAAPLTELAVSVLGFHHGVLPPTLNCDEVDPECPVNIHRAELRKVERPYALKVSFTHMGQCAALVVKKFAA